VVKVLGCQQANHNEFYRRNKSNPEFITTVVNTHGAKPDRFFTETGLYECLFANDSPIAK
jgi:prophage antirepressor-like protein